MIALFDWVSEFETVYANFLNANLTNLAYSPDLVIDDTVESHSEYYVKWRDTEVSQTNYNPTYYDESALLFFDIIHTDHDSTAANVELNLYEILKEIDRIFNVKDQTFPSYKVSMIQNVRPSGHGLIIPFQIEFKLHGATRGV